MTDILERANTLSRSSTTKRRRRPKSTTQRVFDVLRTLTTLAILFFVMFPILWLALTAFKPEREVFSTSIIFRPSLASFREILFGANNLVHPMYNSIVIAVVTTVLSVPLALLAAYGFSRYRFPGNKPILLAIVITQFIPGVAIALPFLTMFRDLGLLDTKLALIVANLAIVVPYNTWLLKGFVDGLPIEVEEAARLDGCGQLRLLWRVITPLAAPGIFVGVVFAFLLSWNEFLFPTFLARADAITLPVSLISLERPEGIQWGPMAAAGLLVMVPMIVLATLVRKHFAQGMTLGAVK
ncbi:carbohydrate ABC transporter permease [Rhodococcus sp. NPDC059969]|uniref:carbohydrate ABC transporter permease n=1 Tax=unclassified Rhodococcus (in: high G+C Gram-positive bacteria) TaxID=192944 RepID=UPI003673520B